jgi:virginiamycin B lyase
MIGGAPAPQIPDRELPMSRRFIALRAAIAAVAAWLFMSAGPVAAQAPALSGKIASDREGPMEGVLVSAKKPGGTITVTVVSDAKGDYAFPADRLELGRYELMIRAAGYALDGSGALELAPGKTAKADLRLKPAAITTDQLTNSEWMTSVPGPEDLKRAMLNCADCHSLHRIFESKHTAADFLKVFERMGGYYPGASDMQPQRLTGEHRRPAVNPAIAQRLADYLASVNLSSQSRHEFELKSWPRAVGRARRVITPE